MAQIPKDLNGLGAQILEQNTRRLNRSKRKDLTLPQLVAASSAISQNFRHPIFSRLMNQAFYVAAQRSVGNRQIIEVHLAFGNAANWP